MRQDSRREKGEDAFKQREWRGCLEPERQGSMLRRNFGEQEWLAQGQQIYITYGAYMRTYFTTHVRIWRRGGTTRTILDLECGAYEIVKARIGFQVKVFQTFDVPPRSKLRKGSG